jgi:hypothetical protein
MRGGLAACGTTLLVRQNVTGLHVWDKPCVCLVIWSVWSIWLVSWNQTNQTDRTDQMNKSGWRTFSASC